VKYQRLLAQGEYLPILVQGAGPPQLLVQGVDPLQPLAQEGYLQLLVQVADLLPLPVQAVDLPQLLVQVEYLPLLQQLIQLLPLPLPLLFRQLLQSARPSEGLPPSAKDQVADLSAQGEWLQPIGRGQSAHLKASEKSLMHPRCWKRCSAMLHN
jgi:hypothetical protein